MAGLDAAARAGRQHRERSYRTLGGLEILMDGAASEGFWARAVAESQRLREQSRGLRQKAKLVVARARAIAEKSQGLTETERRQQQPGQEDNERNGRADRQAKNGR